MTNTDTLPHPAVADAHLVRIDWQAEAELIKANSPK